MNGKFIMNFLQKKSSSSFISYLFGVFFFFEQQLHLLYNNKSTKQFLFYLFNYSTSLLTTYIHKYKKILAYIPIFVFLQTVGVLLSVITNQHKKQK